jgi:hypothetical protein
MNSRRLTIAAGVVSGLVLCNLLAPAVHAQVQGALTPEMSVRLILIDRLKSGHSRKGERVNFRVDDDVVDASGAVLIRKGTPAYGTVTQSRGNGMFGKRGLLAISIDYTTAIDGQRVPLRAQNEKQGRSGSKTSLAIFTLVTPLGLFVKGSNAGAEPGTLMMATIDSTVRVEPGGVAPVYGGATPTTMAAPAAAGPAMTLVLHSGSKITGRLDSLAGGVYTVATPHGALRIPAAEVRSITDAASAARPAPVRTARRAR